MLRPCSVPSRANPSVRNGANLCFCPFLQPATTTKTIVKMTQVLPMDPEASREFKGSRAGKDYKGTKGEGLRALKDFKAFSASKEYAESRGHKAS